MPYSNSESNAGGDHKLTQEVADVRWCPVKTFNCDRFYNTYLRQSLDAHQVANGGPLCQLLAKRIKTLIGSERAVVPAASGTAALHALVAVYEQWNERPLRWIVQAFTFPPSVQGPLRDSVVVDVDLEHGGPCVAELTKRKDKFDGVVVTNVTGALADTEFYETWCQANEKILIFDNAAVAIGQVAGRCIHDFGDGAIVSLHETKPIGRGEGGAIIVPFPMEKTTVSSLNFGFHSGSQLHSRVCNNWKMSDIAAAAILDHLDNVVDQDWITQYQERLVFVNQLLAENSLHHFQEPHYPSLVGSLRIILPDGVMSSDVVKKLNGLRPMVEAKLYYRPLDNIENVPLSWQIYNRTVCLPFHLDLREDQLRFMIDQLAKCCHTSVQRGAFSCES